MVGTRVGQWLRVVLGGGRPDWRMEMIHFTDPWRANKMMCDERKETTSGAASVCPLCDAIQMLRRAEAELRENEPGEALEIMAITARMVERMIPMGT